MTSKRRGAKALGLILLSLLGLMAFMAAGAQVEAEFLYLEGGVTKTLAGDSLPTISAHTHLILLVPAKNLEILCAKVESDTTAPVELLGTNRTPNGGIGHGHLKFKECKAFTISPLTEQAKCVPDSPGLPPGELLGGGLLKLILHPANNTMMLLEALKEKQLISILFPETCALFPEASVTGTIVFECGELNPPGTYVGGSCSTHRVTQLLKSASEALSKELKDELRFGLSTAFLDGIIAVKFGAPCVSCAWGADAD